MSLKNKSSIILLLDDDANRKSINSSRLRVSVGTEVELALNGFHAAHLLEKDQYNLVLLFENPSDMPADELISLIRINHSKEKLPIVYFSRKASEEEINNKIELGVNDYLGLNEKFNFGQLVKAVEKYIK